MSINNAILGILSFAPLTGYDLKKIMQESSFMYWSGNNNQIYKALMELRDEDYITMEIHHQESLPSRKICTITDKGIFALKEWTLKSPEVFEIKKPFLIQLALSGQLDNSELESLLNSYESEISGRISFENGKKNKQISLFSKTERDKALIELIYENIIDSYCAELEWLNKVRKTLSQFESDKYNNEKTEIEGISGSLVEEKDMSYQVIEKNNKSYIKLNPSGNKIEKEKDASEILSLCFEHKINLVLIPKERLSEDFFNLKTKLAGSILQKLVNYNIKSVVVLGNEEVKGRFKEFLIESNKGSSFRAYENFNEAESWLLN